MDFVPYTETHCNMRGSLHSQCDLGENAVALHIQASDLTCLLFEDRASETFSLMLDFSDKIIALFVVISFVVVHSVGCCQLFHINS